MFQNEITDVVGGLDRDQLKDLTRFAVNAIFNKTKEGDMRSEQHFVVMAITDGVIPPTKVESVINPKTSEHHQLDYLKRPIDVKEHHEHVKAGEGGKKYYHA